MRAKAHAGGGGSEGIPVEILLTLVDSLDAMLAYWDAHEVCVFANDAYRDWFGRTRDQMHGITMRELLGPLYAKNLPYIRAAFAGEKQRFEREITTPHGQVRHSLATYTPHIVSGTIRGIFVHVADVTPLKHLESELKLAKTKAESLATHDFLTGLPNRLLLQDRLFQMLAHAKRQQSLFAVLTIDLDDFKEVNDTYGHRAGDRLLVEIAGRLKSAVREEDTVARLGGDEFVVLMPEIDSKSKVEEITVRLLDAVGRPFRADSDNVTPSCSVGIALYPEHGLEPEALLANSDRALYAAKRCWKGRYAFVSQKR